ncbi:MAG: hypothetical protein LBQ89_08195 [Treponema sp.]|jgi:hypothetical protein|nr:hypothetical protein [Treponema sp.]
MPKPANTGADQATGGATPSPGGADIPLEELNKEQLLAYALEKKIDVNYTATAEEILAVIKAAQNESSGDNAQVPDKDGDKGTQGDGNAEKPPSSSGEGKRRIKNVALKGKAFNIGNGTVVTADNDGIFEVDEAQAKRLLTISGYEEA